MSVIDLKPPSKSDLRLFMFCKLMVEQGVTGPAALPYDLITGMRLAIKHPEWVVAFMAQTASPESRILDELIEYVRLGED